MLRTRRACASPARRSRGGLMLRISAVNLTVVVMAVVGVTTASATTITDPIVRTRGGGAGSYQISTLPYSFNFGTFPTDPDTLQENIDRGMGENCVVGTDTGTISNPGTGLPMVSCEFQ